MKASSVADGLVMGHQKMDDVVGDGVTRTRSAEINHLICLINFYKMSRKSIIEE